MIAAGKLQGRTVLGVVGMEDNLTMLVVVGTCLLMFMGVGLAFRRFSSDTSDYFRAGGRATWWILGGSLFMQGFSAWTFTGAAGAAFHAGWSLPVMFFANVVVFSSVAIFTAYKFRQLRVITGADVIRLRFGPELEQFTAYLGAITSPFFGGVQLFGLAIFTSSLLGVNVYLTIIILGFVVLFYSALSGAWAVLATDFIQVLILLPISLLLAGLCLYHFGGIGGFLAEIKTAGLSEVYAPFKSQATLATIDGISAGSFTIAFFIAWYMNGLINANALGNASKFLSAKDGKAASKAAILTAVLMGLGLMIWFIPPMTARMLIADHVMGMPLNNPAEGAYAAISMHFLPAGLVAMVLVAMCAATMSSLDSGLTGLAGNITENIYPALCRKLGFGTLTGRPRLIFGKFVNLSCALYIIAIALYMAHAGRGGVFQVLMDVIATIMAPGAAPMLLAIYLKRVPRVAPFIAIICGFGVALPIYLGPKFFGWEPWLFQEQIAVVMGISAVAFLIARRLCPQDADMERREKEFFSRMNRPVNFERETGQNNDHTQLRIVGAFGLVIALGTLLLLIPSSSRGDELKILIIALSTAAASGFMVWKGGRPSNIRPTDPANPSIK